MSQAVRKPCFSTSVPRGQIPPPATATPTATPTASDGVAVAMAVALAAAVGGFGPLGIEVEKTGSQTAWNITGQKFQGLGLKLKAFTLAFRDLASLLCQKVMRVAD